MKKLCSCLLIATISLGQFGVNGYALKKNTNSAPRVAQEKVSWLRENSQKSNTSLSEVNTVEHNVKDALSKSQTKDKKKSPKVTNVNVDLNIPAIALSTAILGSVALQEYAKSKRPNIFKQFYSATGESISSVWDSAKCTVADLWSFGKENVPAVVEWTKDGYDSLFYYVKSFGGGDSSVYLTLIGMGLLAYSLGPYFVRCVVGSMREWLNLPIGALTSIGRLVGKAIGAPFAGLFSGVKSAFKLQDDTLI